MRPLRFVCLSTILLNAMALAQSVSVPSINQTTRVASPTSSSQLPSTHSRAAAHQANPAQASGLDFAPVVVYGSGGYDATSVVVADVNGDGKPDLVVTNCSFTGGCTSDKTGAVGVLLGNGDGTFQTAMVYSSGGYVFATSVAVADVNGDGKPDLLVTNTCAISDDCSNGSVTVLLNNGDGTFQTAVPYNSGGQEPYSVAVADVNGDGKPDLVVANSCASYPNCANVGVIGVLLGNGNGTFQTAATYGSGGWQADSIAVADVNGDGRPDLIVMNECASGASSGDCPNTAGLVGVLLGNGDGTFQTVATYDSGVLLGRFVAVADVNGDGKPDLLTAGCSTIGTTGFNCLVDNIANGAVGVLLGNGDGTFQTAVAYNSGAQEPYSVAVADVNGDGKPDLVVANFLCLINSCPFDLVGVLLGNGDGTFQTAATYGSGAEGTASIAVADVNGDGKPDLLVANSCGTDSCFDYGTVGVLINTSLTATTTALTSSQNPSNFGQLVTFTATVTAQQGFYKGTPTGTVTFTYGSTTLCNAVTLSGGVATCAYSALPVGSDVVTAAYSGDGNFAPSSGTVTQTVNQASTTTGVASWLNPSTFNQQVTFTATVTGQFGGTPTGTVTFSDGVTTLGASPLSSGTATFSTGSLKSGLHSINAVYSGDSNFTGSSASLNQTVNQASTTLALTSSVNPSGFGQSVTFTATIMPQYGGQASGTITFKDGATTLGSAAVSGNAASLTTSGLAVGTHSITAIYGGDSNFTGSTSTVLSQVVQGPAVSLSPARLIFSTQVVFTTSKTQAVTLTNTGLGILNITKITVTGPFTQTNTCGSTVNAGGSCTFTVTFKPKTLGTLTGSVSITDNASGSPQKITLTGVGTYIQLSPTSLNFGNQPVGTKSLPKKITLSNKGNVAVSITRISLTGANAGDFAQTNTCGKSVAAGASCSITVTFTPSAKGKRTASVSVSDNGGGSPQTASVSGTGT